MQLQLIPETIEKTIERETQELQSQITTLRKALFARHSEISKQMLEIKNEFDVLRSALCRANKEQVHETSSRTIPLDFMSSVR